MAVRKRGSTWQIDYTDPTGKRIRKSFKKKKDAELEHGKRISLIGEGRYLDVKRDYKTTMADLLKKYKENFKDQRSFDNWKELCLRNFKAYFGEYTLLANIRYVDVETYRNHLKTKLTHKGTLRADASVNREISCLHHLFQKAVEWEMSERSPFERGKTLLIKENNARLRYLAEEEIDRLLKSCAPHLQEIIICALNSGMRRGEIFSLKWEQVRNGFIYLQKTKTNEPRQIPVNDALNDLFKGIQKRQKVGTESVFTYSSKTKRKEHPSKIRNLRNLQTAYHQIETLEAQEKQPRGRIRVVNPAEGNPVNNVKHSFESAVKRAGIADFRFHDLRHTFASHMIMRGASLKEIQEILGHKTMTMTLRYAHLSQEHKKKAVNLLNGLTAPRTDTTSQNVTKPDFDQSTTKPYLVQVADFSG